DIAELAGVSKATASLVLNGRGKELRVGAGDARARTGDIAELAGVSKATASLVLNGRGKELRVGAGDARA
ncbi:hypothetical protein CKJ90_32935, partial [Klebsiella pneumoniae]